MNNKSKKYIQFASIVSTVVAVPLFIQACGDGGSNQNQSESVLIKAERDYANNILNYHIVPLFQNTLLQNKVLQDQISTMCSKSTLVSQDYENVQSAWKKAMLAWTQASHLTIETVNKPYVRDFSYVYVFPDKRQGTKNNVNTLFNNTVTLDSTWAENANTRQVGLVSMEYIIFNKISSQNFNQPTPSRACELLTVQAQQLVKDTSAHLALWKGDYGKTFTTSKEDYAEKNSVLIAWFNSIVVTNRIIKDKKLGYASGFTTTGKIKNHFESQFADISVPIYRSSFEMFKRSVLGTGKKDGLIDYIKILSTQTTNAPKAKTQLGVIEKIKQQVASIELSLDAITETDFNKVSKEKRRALHTQVSNLYITLHDETPDILDIYVKFNQEDGD